MNEKSDNNPRPLYIKRVEKEDPEKRLSESLIKKYGERFSDYRKQYFKILDNPKNEYDSVAEYQLNVLDEVLNKCNLECIMCLTSHRKGPTTVISDEMISKLINEFEENNLDEELWSKVIALADGDQDKADKYLAKKRKAIGKSIKSQKKTNLRNEKFTKQIINLKIGKN